MKILVRALIAAACLHFLASCGGGVSSDNASSTTTFTLQPGTAEAYSGVELLFTINGGQPPYTVSSSNSVIAPVAAANLSTKSFSIIPNYTSATIPVVITVFDHAGAKVESTLNVNPNVIANSLTITPQATASGQPGTISCGSSVCSGGYASVEVTLTSPTQSVVNRPVRFDVDQGSFTFLQDSLGTLTGPSYSTATDANGHARAVLRADAFAPSQIAMLRVTDLVTGSVLRASFNIVRVTDGSTVLSVLPQAQQVLNIYKGSCAVGVSVDFLVVGGAAPYTVGSSVDAVASLFQTTVLTDGGRFTARTNGGCGTTLMTVTDSMGRTATATLEALEGTTDVPAVVPFTVQPNTGSLVCGGSASFTIAGGTGPFVVTSSSDRVTADIVPPITGRTVTVKRLTPDVAVNSPSTVSIGVSNGVTNTTITLVVPAVCPSSAAPPASTPITFSPSTAVLACGEATSFTISGGSGSYPLPPTSSQLLVSIFAIAGNTFSVLRGIGGTINPSAGANVAVSINVTDSGANTAVLPISAKNICP